MTIQMTTFAVSQFLIGRLKTWQEAEILREKRSQFLIGRLKTCSDEDMMMRINYIGRNSL